ncbi:MAG: Propeptide, PepSY amd peptidase [Candidatus Solibacter sp.]|nr:Propeptide, PepSY amd peptidase [Candidatus Solibacter sp.]
MSVRTAFLKLHLWVGLAAALLVTALAITGTMLVFENEIDRALNPMMKVAPQAGNRPIAEIVDRVRQQFKRPVLNVGMNPHPDLAWQLMVPVGKQITLVYVDPHTAQVTGSRPFRTSFMFYVHQFHTNLLLGKKGELWVGYGNACLMFLLITGVILWWKRKMLTVETSASWRRINFDLHHVSGIYSLVFLFVIVGTGLLMSFPNQMYPMVELFTGDTAKEEPEEKPESTPPAQRGAPSLTPDQALAIAQAQLPGASPTFMTVPLAPKQTYNISFKYPEDGTPGGRSHVELDRYSGAVLWVDNTRKVATGPRFANNVRPLHTGDIYGWPSRIFYALASFSVVIQAITGVIIWALRFFKKKVRTPQSADAVQTVA